MLKEFVLENISFFFASTNNRGNIKNREQKPL